MSIASSTFSSFQGCDNKTSSVTDSSMSNSSISGLILIDFSVTTSLLIFSSVSGSSLITFHSMISCSQSTAFCVPSVSCMLSQCLDLPVFLPPFEATTAFCQGLL